MAMSAAVQSAESPAGGRIFPIAWHEPLLLSPIALHVFFLVYALNCIVFYQDRWVFDTAEWLGSGLLTKGTFWTSHGRAFVQIPPQVPPWLAIQAGLSLKGIVVAYSLGYCLYHYAFALVLYYGFRRRDLTALLVLIIVLHLVHNNFYMQAEPMHMVPWVLCVLAMLQQPAGRFPGRAMLALGVALFSLIAVSAHLLGLPVLLVIGVYAFLTGSRRKQLLPVLILMLATLAAFYIHRKTAVDSYERKRLAQIGLDMLMRNAPEYLRYYLFGHTYAIAGMALIIARGFFYRTHRLVYWIMALSMLAYATLLASFSPLFFHLYHWYGTLPVYLIMGIPFFDARFPTPGSGFYARLLLAVAIPWAAIGTVSDLHALRERRAFQLHLADALAEDGKQVFLMDNKRLSLDYSKEILTQWYLAEESSERTALVGRSNATILWPRTLGRRSHWMFDASRKPTPYLPWFPLKMDELVPTMVPVEREKIQQRAAQVELEFQERPSSLNVIDGWLCNYVRPPKVVYSVPVAVKNSGTLPFPCRDKEGSSVMFGYYWHLDGKILYEDLRAEYLPIDVKSTFHHVLNVQRSGIPNNARLVVDLFLDGRPLLHPEIYQALSPNARE